MYRCINYNLPLVCTGVLIITYPWYVQVKLVSEKVKVESQSRDTSDKRNMELELLLTKLRSRDTSDADFEATK